MLCPHCFQPLIREYWDTHTTYQCTNCDTGFSADLPLIQVADIIGTDEIARLAAVGNPAVSNWTRRYGDFPQPIAYVSKIIPIYNRNEIIAWLSRTGRLPNDKP